MGLRLAMLRKQLGWNQTKVAEACDLSCATVSRVEKGSQFLTLPALFRLAAVLGVEPGKLIPDLEDLENAGYPRKMR